VLAVWSIVLLFSLLDGGRPGAAAAGAVIAVTAPLFWLTAVRPLSDMSGLAAAVAVQVLLLRARTPHELFWALGGAGFSMGIRSQVAWLTLPFAGYAAYRMARHASRGFLASAAGAYGAGVLCWALPLVLLTGGSFEYWQALTAQGAEDFANVSMLLTSFLPRLAMNALRDTFVVPWGSSVLATIVLAAAGVGLVLTAFTDRRSSAAMAIAFGPYAVFHLLLQETFTTRYACPSSYRLPCMQYVDSQRLDAPELAG
jgi:hypothetical protein